MFADNIFNALIFIVTVHEHIARIYEKSQIVSVENIVLVITRWRN